MKSINLLKIVIIISVLICLTGMKKNERKYMSILKNKPVFSLKLEGFGVQYVVLLNGVLLYQQNNSGGQMNTSFPVNHYMHPVNNNIALVVWPDEDEAPISPHARVKIQLQVSSHNNTDSEHTVASINYQNKLMPGLNSISESSLSGKFSIMQNIKADKNGNIEVFEIIAKDRAKETKGMMQFSRNIKIPSTLPLWAFFEVDDLPKYRDMNDIDYYNHMDVLLSEYMKIQKALENKQVNTILTMFDERNKELDAAFYNAPGTLEKEIKEALIEAANNKELKLVELKKDYLDFMIHDNNKLIGLTRVGDEPAIVFNYTSGIGSQSFDLIFRMKDGKWILTR